MIPEDADLRTHLAALGRDALAELERVLRAPTSRRAAILRALVARPAYADLAALIAMADTDKAARLRLLRAIRDLGHSPKHSPTPSKSRRNQPP